MKEIGKNRVVLVAGGGIAGLAAGASLASLGFRVHILEQADDFREVGAGVQLAPNGIRALMQLGLFDEVQRLGWRPPALVMRDAFSAEDIVNIPLGETFRERFEAPYMVIHRADLLAILLNACKKYPSITLETSARVAEVIEGDGDGVGLKLEDGRVLRGDALIGADGLRSAVRQAVVNDGAPQPPRYVVYRGVVPRDQVPTELWQPEVVMWTGPDADFVHYPVRAGELFNLVVTYKAKEKLDPTDIRGNRDEMLAPYTEFHSNVRRLLDLLKADRRWTVTDREPVKGWSRGPITLIGDAAHPMLQYMAQGACQALEDVVQLTQDVQESPEDLAKAFASYADKRYLRTARVQFSARQMIELCQVKGLLAEVRANYFGGRTEQELHDGLAWLYSRKPDEMFV